jgi:hypothetical protein
MIVHILHNGAPRCRFSAAVPRDWPPEHRWISLDDYRGPPSIELAHAELCVNCIRAVGPNRLRRERTKGWRTPKGAIYVGRPSKFGNPFIDYKHPKRADACVFYVARAGTTVTLAFPGGPGTDRDCVYYFERWVAGELADVRGMVAVTDAALRIRKSIEELRGRDLLCWCALDKRCHADVLLRLANQSR